MYYHGTTKGNTDDIVKTQLMIPSVGDEQWLGDGCYFYVDAEYAFRWILIKYTNNFRNEFSADYSNIYGEYTIVSAEINIDDERLFSMKNNSVVDGVVFNL